MGWPEIIKLATAGGVGLALAVGILFVTEMIVSGKAYLRKCAECNRERDRAERAEQRLIDTIPVLTQAYEQIARLPHVAEKTVETVVKTVGGKRA